MFLVTGSNYVPGNREPVIVYEKPNDDRKEALKNLQFVFGLGIFDIVTVSPAPMAYVILDIGGLYGVGPLWER